jgi:hypothetical protein
LQTLADLKLDPEPGCGTVRHTHLYDLARIHTGNLHLGAFGQPFHIRQFRIEVDMARECFVPVPDEENPGRKDRHSGQNEESDEEIVTTHVVIPPA